MAALLPSASPPRSSNTKGELGSCRLAHFSQNPFVAKSMCSRSVSKSEKKQVWIWTKRKEVMTAAVERGWNTFIFRSDCRELTSQWMSMALLSPLFIEEGELFDEVSSPSQLENLQPLNDQTENIVVNLLEWQIIPAENIVAAIQGTQKTFFAISKASSDAQLFFEALEHGLSGVVLKTEDVDAIFELKVIMRVFP